MAERLESVIEAAACSRAQMEIGIENVKLAGRRGAPDRLFLIPGGRPLFIEFKRPGKVPTKFQALLHKRWKSYGYEVESSDSVEGALNLIRAACSRVAIVRGYQRAGKVAPPQVPTEGGQVPPGA